MADEVNRYVINVTGEVSGSIGKKLDELRRKALAASKAVKELNAASATIGKTKEGSATGGGTGTSGTRTRAAAREKSEDEQRIARIKKLGYMSALVMRSQAKAAAQEKARVKAVNVLLDDYNKKQALAAKLAQASAIKAQRAAEAIAKSRAATNTRAIDAGERAAQTLQISARNAGLALMQKAENEARQIRLAGAKADAQKRISFEALAQDRINRAEKLSQDLLTQAAKNGEKARLQVKEVYTAKQSTLARRSLRQLIADQQYGQRSLLGYESAYGGIQVSGARKATSNTQKVKTPTAASATSVLNAENAAENRRHQIVLANRRAEEAEKRRNHQSELARLRSEASASRRSSRGSSSAGSGATLQGVVGLGIGTGAAISAAREIYRDANAYTTLQNKIRAVSESEEQRALISARLFEMAKQSRTSIETTTMAYQRYDQALAEVGIGSERVMNIVETLNKVLITYGSTGAEAASMMVQLSQGFGRNAFLGDELRAVLENFPPLARQIAKDMGVTVGALKELGSQGKISGLQVAQSIERMKAQTDKTFSGMALTMDQAFTNLRTSAIEKFGKDFEGLMGNLAKVVQAVADNLYAVGIALGVLLARFGGGIAKRAASSFAAIFSLDDLDAASKRTAKGGIFQWASSNKFSILAGSIAGVTLGVKAADTASKDLSRQWSEIGDKLSVFWQLAKEAFNGLASLFKDLTKSTLGYGVTLGDVFRAFLTGVGDAVGYMIDAFTTGFALIVGGVNGMIVAIERIIGSLPAAFAQIWVKIEYSFTMWATQFEGKFRQFFSGLVGWIDKSWGAELAAGAADALNKAADMQQNPQKFVNTETMMKGTIWHADFWQELGRDIGIMQQAAQDEMQKTLVLAKMAATIPTPKTNTTLRGDSAPRADAASGKPNKEAESRARLMQRLNFELDKEAARLKMLEPLRSNQNRLDDIEEKFLKYKNGKLTPDELNGFAKKIAANQKLNEVMQKADAIFAETNAPAKEYNDTMAALSELVKQNAISQQELNRHVLLAREAFENAKDPLREFNKSLQEELELTKIVGPAKEVEVRVRNLINDAIARGLPLSQAQVESYRQMFTQIELGNKKQQLQNQILEQTTTRFADLTLEIEAWSDAYRDGIVTADMFKAKMVETGVSISQLRLEMGEFSDMDFLANAMSKVLGNFKNIATSLSDIYGTFFQEFTDGFANSIGRAIAYSEDFGTALNDVARSALANLISAIVNMGIQYVAQMTMMQAFGATAMASQAATSMATGSQTAAAWAPAATMTSLASFGANAAPAMAGMAATSALSTALSAIGFQGGGYTGSGGVDQVAGLVHGKEFVMNAAATQRIGVANLQALQDGRSLQGAAGNSASVGNSGGAAAAAPNVNVTTPVNVAVVSNNQAALSAMSSRDGQKVIIDAIEKNSSRIGKMLGG